MANREVTDVARQQNSLRCVEDEPASHRIPDRGVFYKGVGGNLAHHVKMHRVVSDPAALAQLLELDPLNLKLSKALPENYVRTKVGTGLRRVGGRRRKVVTDGIPAGNNPDAPRQQRYRRASIDRGQIG